jgi:hypothetical protein
MVDLAAAICSQMSKNASAANSSKRNLLSSSTAACDKATSLDAHNRRRVYIYDCLCMPFEWEATVALAVCEPGATPASTHASLPSQTQQLNSCGLKSLQNLCLQCTHRCIDGLSNFNFPAPRILHVQIQCHQAPLSCSATTPDC